MKRTNGINTNPVTSKHHIQMDPPSSFALFSIEITSVNRFLSAAFQK